MWIVGLSRFVIVFVLRPLLQDEPELQPDEEGLVARALGGPVSRSWRSARRAGLGEARFVIWQDFHIESGFICWFFHLL